MRDRSLHPRQRRFSFEQLLEQLEPRVLLSAAATWRGGRSFSVPREHPIVTLKAGTKPAAAPSGSAITPSQMAHAYGMDQIAFAGANGGSGQTIAIIDAYDDPNAWTDLQAFDAAYGLPDPPSFKKVSQTGSTTSLPGTDPSGPSGTTGTSSWEIEESLDIEWAHAMAPAANIILVECNSTSTTNLVAAGVNWARTQVGVSVISMSFGGSESSGETTYDTYFTTPSAHTGVTFVASAGDTGAPAEYPAASPNVLSVGGTTLTLTGAGDYSNETAWSGTGGGASSYETQPTYQKGIVALQSTTARTTPDVAADADPNSGVAVYDSWDYPSNPWLVVGGTSLAAPLWAGLIAVADQGRATLGLGTLDGKTQTLPMLYALPSSDFHDVTSGTSTGSPNLSAAVGYDMTTGRGTPVGPGVVYGLMGTSSIGGTVFQDNNSDGVLNGTDAALAGTFVYIDSNNNGIYDAGTTTTVSKTTSASIPNNNTTGLTSSLTVSGATGTVTNLSVTLNITHPLDSDLTAYLIAPDGNQILLFTGLTGANFTNTTFSDQATTSITSGTAPYTGTFRAVDALADFNGKSANGTWSLKVVDGVKNNSGSLTSWTLKVTTGAVDAYAANVDATGHYSFYNLPLGVSYNVHETTPAGYFQTTPNGGSGYSTSPLLTALAQVNFGNFPTSFTTAGATGSFYLATDSTDTYLRISSGTTGLSPATYQVALANLPNLTFNLTGANSVLVVDFSNGSPIAGNITLNIASPSSQELQIVGQNPGETFTLSDTQLALEDGGALAYQALPTLTLNTCTVNVTGDLANVQNINVNSGATLSF
ncbi:MAG TPA: proprotein convertase P-domain-containing protein [Phycisphaerae bacterium]|nr:proprotein convertase P-domain-containing protein [Phycisphaerae bacterium]